MSQCGSYLAAQAHVQESRVQPPELTCVAPHCDCVCVSLFRLKIPAEKCEFTEYQGQKRLSRRVKSGWSALFPQPDPRTPHFLTFILKSRPIATCCLELHHPHPYHCLVLLHHQHSSQHGPCRLLCLPLSASATCITVPPSHLEGKVRSCHCRFARYCYHLIEDRRSDNEGQSFQSGYSHYIASTTFTSL